MESTIFSVCEKGDLSTLKEIIDNGVNIHSIDEHGNSLVHVIAKYNHHKLFWYLHKKDITVNVKNKDGDTPLHVACKHHSLRTIIELLRYVSNPRDKNLEGKTAFDYLTSQEKEIMQHEYDRIYGLGKYAYQEKSETPHMFGCIR